MRYVYAVCTVHTIKLMGKTFGERHCLAKIITHTHTHTKTAGYALLISIDPNGIGIGIGNGNGNGFKQSQKLGLPQWH